MKKVKNYFLNLKDLRRETLHAALKVTHNYFGTGIVKGKIQFIFL